MPDRMEMLREASEKATKGKWYDQLHHEKRDGGRFHAFVTAGQLVPICAVPTGVEGFGREEGRANAALIPLAVNFVRDLLSGTWPDQEAVERGARAMWIEVGGDPDLWDQTGRGSGREWVAYMEGEKEAYCARTRAALTAALGLTVLERG